MYPAYIGKSVVLLRAKDRKRNFKFIIGILDNPVEFDKIKKRFVRIIALVLFNDTGYDQYIDVIARFYNIIGQDSLREEILSIAESDETDEEDKISLIKELFVKEELSLYGQSEVTE